MLSFTTLSSLRSDAIWSSTGAIAWHGPHHSAQRWAGAGWPAAGPSFSKVCSVTVSGISSFLPQVSDGPNVRAGTPVPARYDRNDETDVQAAAERARPSGSRTGAARALGAGADLRTPARAEPRQASLELHRRPDHGQQPHGRPSRLGPGAEGRLPALQGAARLRREVPEWLRLPGALGRGRGREGARSQLEARDRGLRPRRVRRALQGARRQVRRRHDAAVEAPRPVDGLGQRLPHVLGHEHRVHLAVPRRDEPARLAVQGPPLDAVVPSLRHLALAARAGGRGGLQGARAPVALRALPSEGARGRG